MSDNSDTPAVGTDCESAPVAAFEAAYNELLTGLTERISAPDAPFEPVALALATIDDLTAQLGAVTAERDALKDDAVKAGTEPKVKPGRVRAGRKISAKAAKGEFADEAELLAAIMAASTVEVAFSDGVNELAGVASVLVEGRAWAVTQAGVQLRLDPLVVHGPAPGQRAYPLRGYGLFLDGKLAAYRDRGGLLEIGGGTNMNLGPDILFTV